MITNFDKRGTQAEQKITLLENSIYFFLDSVFIQEQNEGYRLVVSHQQRVLADQHYPTIRGAKIAFTKLFSENAWEEGVRAFWSPFYCPDNQWLSTRLPENLKTH